MADTPVVHSTFVIERTFSKAPGKVFAAFAEPERKRRWYARGEHHTLREYQLDFRVGGAERWWATFDLGTPFAGTRLASDGVLLDIVPEARIVMASDMRFGDQRISVSLITIEIAAVSGGSRLVFTHQGAFFEGADGPQIREEGWQELLDRLQAELEGVPVES
jgi:uncharacterized protein YndB with AHSA1/START domain